MPNYPYSTVLQKIKPLLLKIKSIGIPSKVDNKWLQSIGYKSSNDPSLIPVLKNIQFIDSSGQPTDYWTQYRADNKVLATCIRIAYKNLFETYPNANNETKEHLNSFFSTKTTAGAQVISKMVGTFLELCACADFSGITPELESTPIQPNGIQQNTGSIIPETIKTTRNGMSISINIQLTVPETTDEKIYDAFFSSMKKHLLS